MISTPHEEPNSIAYDWVHDWAVVPQSESSRTDGRTHGIAITRDGFALVFHSANPALLIFDADGRLQNAWGDRFPGAHGLTLVEEEGQELLWLTDFETGEVVKTTLDGETIANLARPPAREYDKGYYCPTWVAVDEERYGGGGDIWLADGYGESLVHRFDKSGAYLSTLDGVEGAGRFRHAHGVFIDRRKAEPELYITDRMNRRIQVYDLDGHYRRAFGEKSALSPCMFATWRDLMFIPEAPYRARLTILDKEDREVAALGENDEVCSTDGFPNDRSLLRPGKFNSPHDVAIDSQGNVFVVEWIIGGRITKLIKR